MSTLEKFGLGVFLIALAIRFWRLNVPLVLLLMATCLSAQTNLLNTNKTYSVILAWDANTETDLAGYNVYYGQSSGYYTTKVNAGLITTNKISGLLKGPRYYFVVTAYNTNGLESDPSNEVSIQAPKAPTIRVQSVLQAAISPLGPWWPVRTNDIQLAEEAAAFFRDQLSVTLEPDP